MQNILMKTFSLLKGCALITILSLLMGAGSCLKSKEDNPPPAPGDTGTAAVYDWNKIADSAFRALNNYYWLAGNQYFAQNNQGNLTFNYWWNAHALDGLTDAYLRTTSTAVKDQMLALLNGVKTKNNNSYINDYYDDMEWMTLACLRAYEATSEMAFKETALLLWEDIKKGWNSNLGGGIAWRKTQTDYKNTPANAPAVMIAARLYTMDNHAEDLDWAKKIYGWLVNNLVDPSTGQVWDGMNREGNGAIDKTWKFTYNHGVVIGAGMDMYRITHEQIYLDAAIKTAHYSMTDGGLAPSGILKNENQGDGGLFKGILVRYLYQLSRSGGLPADTKTSIENFLQKNAESLWSKATSKPLSLFNCDWTSMPSGAVDASTQLSGLFLVEAMAAAKK